MRLLTLFAVAIVAVGLAVTSSPTPVLAASCDTSWTGSAADGNWFTFGNWSAGVPTASTGACLPTGSSAHITGSGAVAGSLSIAAGALLSLDITGCGVVSAYLTVYGDSANAGAIDLNNIGDACGGTAQLTITSPHTLTNTGAINTTGCCRGDRQLTGNVVNQGNVNVNFEAACCVGTNGVLHLDGPGSLFDNQGALNIANGMQAIVSGGAGEEFRNSGGGSVNAGPGCPTCETPGQLIVMAGSTFSEGAGTTSGDHVLLYGGASLHFSGSGSSAFDLRGYQGGNILSGPTIASGQTVELQITGCGPGPFSSIATLANSMTNAGTINLRNLDNACGGTDQIVIPPADTLTNTGTINTTGCCRGDRQLTGNVINQGNVNVNFEAACCVGTNGVLHLDGPGSIFDNQGAFNIQNGMQAIVSGGGGEEFRNSAGGSINAGPGCQICETPGQLIVNAGANFNQGSGTTSGDDVLIDGGAVLDFTGSGSSSFDLHGDQGGNTVSGSVIAAVQTLHLECSSVTTLAGSMASAGIIDFRNNACGSTDQLVIPAGSTLTNTGTIEATGCCGGVRELTGSVTNRGILTFLQGANFGGGTPFTLDGGGTFDNFGTISVNTGDQILNNFSDTLILEPGDAFTLHTDNTLGSFGTYTQGASATLAVTVDANSATNTGIVGGTVIISGGLQVSTLGIPSAGSTWPIINGHLRTGSFATTSFGSIPYTFESPYPAPSSGVTLVAPSVIPPPPPVAVDHAYATPFNTALPVAAPGLLSGDSGTAITVTSTTAPSNGALSAVGVDGSFTYTPTTGFSGTDTFTYTITDSASQTATATVTITVGRPPFIIPAGSTATFTNVQFGACNSLTWGYQLNGGANQAQFTFPGGCGTGSGPDVTVGPFATPMTLLVFLTDNHCVITYNSDGTPVDHAIVSGSNPYSLRFADAGGFCEKKTTTLNNFNGFNFHVDLAIADEPIAATGTNISATEGRAFSGTVATFTDPTTFATSGEYTTTIDWGDGSSSPADGQPVAISGNPGGPFMVNGSHTYKEEGKYAVKVHITDTDSADPTDATSTANVLDAALTAGPACSATSLLSYNGPTATITDGAGPSFGTLSDFSANTTVNWGDGTITAGTVSGNNGGPYTASGSHTYATTGYFTITTSINDVGGATATASCTVLTFAFAPGGGSFVVGDNNAVVGSSVTFWGAQWAKDNSLSGGPAPSSFKGFAENPTTPTCGAGWSADPGNSTQPPDGPLPAYMAVIVTSSAGKSGSRISGNTVHIVIVKTNPGYAPNPGHAGTGTVVAVVC